MDQGDHRTDAELPFEAEPDVNQHREQGRDHSDRPCACKFARNTWAHHFNAAILNRAAERFFDLRYDILLGLFMAFLASILGFNAD